ncbi:MAG: ferredoxin [Candidatus Babeliales bacterium]
MKKVTIEPGCIACGTCAFLAPQVFEVTAQSQVKSDADIKTHAPCIRAAAKACPVQVITYEEE